MATHPPSCSLTHSHLHGTGGENRVRKLVGQGRELWHLERLLPPPALPLGLPGLLLSLSPSPLVAGQCFALLYTVFPQSAQPWLRGSATAQLELTGALWPPPLPPPHASALGTAPGASGKNLLSFTPTYPGRIWLSSVIHSLQFTDTCANNMSDILFRNSLKMTMTLLKYMANFKAIKPEDCLECFM